VAPEHDGTDQRVGRDPPPAAPREIECATHGVTLDTLALAISLQSEPPVPSCRREWHGLLRSAT
jgi:hypothetical protein